MTADVLNDAPEAKAPQRHAGQNPSPWRQRLLATAFRSAPYRAWLRGGTPTAISWAPPVAIPGTAARANTMFQGRYTFAGHTVQSPNDAPWRQAPATPGWIAACHEFGWLADFAAADGPTARKQSRELIRRWIVDFGTWSALAWRADILGLRLLAWLGHADFLMVDAETDFSEVFLRATGEQVRHLARVQSAEADTLNRTIARACLLTGYTSIGRRSAKTERRYQRLIDDAAALGQGRVTRNPDALCRVLPPLLAAQAALRHGSSKNDGQLDAAITAIATRVRTAVHGDGALAVVQGGREGDTEAIASLLARAGVKTPPLAVPGIARLQQGRLLAIAETAEPGADHHAATLAMEVSVGKQRLFVNCGAPDSDDPAWRAAARATAAHTTLVVDDHNQDLVTQTMTTPCVLRGEEGDSIWLDLSSDAYRLRFGIRLSRRLHMAKDGHELVCEDQVLPVRNGADNAATPKTLCARYHLHPKVTASLLGDGRQVLLKLANGVGWMFEVADGTLNLEESVYFGDWGRTRRTKQIVIARPIEGGSSQIVWHLMRVDGRP